MTSDEIWINEEALHAATDKRLTLDLAKQLYPDVSTAVILGADPKMVLMLAARDARAREALTAIMAEESSAAYRDEFRSDLARNGYNGVPNQASSYFDMRVKELYYSDLAQKVRTPEEIADFNDLQNRLVQERARLDKAYEYADQELVEIGRAGLAPFDIGAAGYNIATGNGGLRDYFTAISVVPVGKMFGFAGAALGVEARSFTSFSALKRSLGSPGGGNQWHHIVEQTPGNLKVFGADVIHSTENVVALPASTHIGKGSISAYYSSKDFFTNGQTVRQWLSTQSFQAQRQFGLDVLKRFGK